MEYSLKIEFESVLLSNSIKIPTLILNSSLMEKISRQRVRISSRECSVCAGDQCGKFWRKKSEKG